MTRTDVNKLRTLSDAWVDERFERISNLITEVDDTYDGFVLDGQLHTQFRWDVAEASMTYQKQFILSSLFGRHYTGDTNSAMNRLQYNYKIIKDYAIGLNATGLDFQLVVKFVGNNKVNGFDLLTHFTEKTRLSDVASLIYYQYQHIVPLTDTIREPKTTVPEFKLIAYEDLPYDEAQQTSN